MGSYFGTEIDGPDERPLVLWARLRNARLHGVVYLDVTQRFRVIHVNPEGQPDRFQCQHLRKGRWHNLGAVALDAGAARHHAEDYIGAYDAPVAVAG